MIDVLVQGHLRGDPQRRTAKNGATFATAKLSTTDADGGQHSVSLITFDQQTVEALMALGDGDSLAAVGELGISTYTTKTGETRPALRLVAHRVMTAYEVRRKREAVAGRRDGDTHAARTPTDRQRRHAAVLRAQQPLPGDDLAGLPDDPL